ncbi:MAG: OmpA family protein [Myxococcales bacterium]|nr:OmpA family protein [Myxococcales bacterium]
MKTLTPHLAASACAALFALGCGGSQSSTHTKTEAPETVTRATTVQDMWVDFDYSTEVWKACQDAGLSAPTFRFDSAKLTKEAKSELKSLAQCLKTGDMANAALVVVGHADPQGAAPYNEQLARQRAESVRAHLVARGISPDRLFLSAAGELGASKKANDEEARRVSLVVLDIDAATVRATYTYELPKEYVEKYEATGEDEGEAEDEARAPSAALTPLPYPARDPLHTPAPGVAP